ncbi:MAG: hypothetical protein ACJASL_003387 [Paraglaciecola sp.]|jgi:hypothetical protein
MGDNMAEMMNQLNEQMAVLPQWVQYWMNWMLFIFIVSVVFVWKFKAARYVLITFILTMPVGMMVFYFTQNAHLLGIAHLILWAPLLFGLVKYEVKHDDFSFTSIYGIWLVY